MSTADKQPGLYAVYSGEDWGWHLLEFDGEDWRSHRQGYVVEPYASQIESAVFVAVLVHREKSKP